MVEEPPAQDGYSRNGEARSSRYELDIDLDALTPTEVVAANRYVWEMARATVGNDDQAASRIYDRYASSILESIAALPARNLDHGRAILAAMVESAASDDRRHAASCITDLVESDHEYGLILFDRLLRDPDRAVRDSAQSVLRADVVPLEYADGYHVRPGGLLPLPAAEIAQLVDAHTLAERGENIYRLGQLVFEQILRDQPEATTPQA